MDGAQISVFEQANQVGFGGFLQGEHCLTLETNVLLELLGDFPHEPLEGEPAY